MATVTPTKRNTYVVITSPISPPAQTSKRTRDEYYDTSSKKHCLEKSYDHLQADYSSYTPRTTTYQQPSFQRNLWPGSSDVHNIVSSMLDTHGVHRSHMMSIPPSHSDFLKEISVPFTQGPLTQEMSVSPRNRQFSQQMSIDPVESSVYKKATFSQHLSVPVQDNFSSSMSGHLFNRSWPYLQENVAQQISMQPVKTNTGNQLSVPRVQPNYSHQSSFISQQKKILSAKRTKSSKQKSVELSKHKDVFPQEIVIPTEVEHEKVSKNISCLDMISKNIPQGYFDQNDESLKALETHEKQPDANISQMISEPLKHGDLHDVIHIEESSRIDTSLLEWGIEEFNIDLASELEKWCQNTRHGIINDQKESFHHQNKCDQTKDPHSSSSIPQTVECQLFAGSINGNLTVSRSDSQQINVLEFDQISSLFDRDMPKSNACKNNNDSAYCSTSPSINSNEDIDWEELYDTILSLN
ncbi:heat shock protein [Biomphalaria pfeifferi]|uniref:Heat shock protein n=1 Tax=Biomphalaria pfeifferi TaxID=112525 RepID=A0AAD8BYF1_BIOPF|nr:heat shock protein [Biomphalaria pfeifferi]KAK0063162.1 heat shock protein [Biomphalaria pfeifferi]